MVRPDKRPIIVLGNVQDITQRGNKYVLRVTSLTRPDVLFDIYCEEAAALDIANRRKVLEDPTDTKVEEAIGDFASERAYAFIVTTASVSKFGFTVEADSSNAWVDIDSSDKFLATGTCVEALFVGKYRRMK